MKPVSVPGVGVVQFPDTMSESDIIKAIEEDILPKAKSLSGLSSSVQPQGKTLEQGGAGEEEAARFLASRFTGTPVAPADQTHFGDEGTPQAFVQTPAIKGLQNAAQRLDYTTGRVLDAPGAIIHDALWGAPAIVNQLAEFSKDIQGKPDILGRHMASLVSDLPRGAIAAPVDNAATAQRIMEMRGQGKQDWEPGYANYVATTLANQFPGAPDWLLAWAASATDLIAQGAAQGAILPPNAFKAYRTDQYLLQPGDLPPNPPRKAVPPALAEVPGLTGQTASGVNRIGGILRHAQANNPTAYEELQNAFGPGGANASQIDDIAQRFGYGRPFNTTASDLFSPGPEAPPPPSPKPKPTTPANEPTTPEVSKAPPAPPPATAAPEPPSDPAIAAMEGFVPPERPPLEGVGPVEQAAVTELERMAQRVDRFRAGDKSAALNQMQDMADALPEETRAAIIQREDKYPSTSPAFREIFRPEPPAPELPLTAEEQAALSNPPQPITPTPSVPGQEEALAQAISVPEGQPSAEIAPQPKTFTERLKDEFSALTTKEQFDLAHRDTLTGAFHRRPLLMAIKEDPGLSEHFQGDVIGFKKVNDLHGHHVGDAYLRKMHQVAMGVAEEIDPTGNDLIWARIGGDEAGGVARAGSGLREKFLGSLAKALEKSYIKTTDGTRLPIEMRWATADGPGEEGFNAVSKRLTEISRNDPRSRGFEAHRGGSNSLLGRDGNAVQRVSNDRQGSVQNGLPGNQPSAANKPVSEVDLAPQKHPFLHYREFRAAAARGKLRRSTGKWNAAEIALNPATRTPFLSGEAAGYSPEDVAHFYAHRAGWDPKASPQDQTLTMVDAYDNYLADYEATGRVPQNKEVPAAPVSVEEGPIKPAEGVPNPVYAGKSYTPNDLAHLIEESRIAAAAPERLAGGLKTATSLQRQASEMEKALTVWANQFPDEAASLGLTEAPDPGKAFVDQLHNDLAHLIEESRIAATVPSLSIRPYSEKSFILTGNTKDRLDDIKKLRVWKVFNKKANGWIFNNRDRKLVEQGLGIEAPQTQGSTEPVFIGNLDLGAVYGDRKILGNFERKRDAIERCNSFPRSKVEGYLGGKFPRGWIVVEPTDPTASFAKERVGGVQQVPDTPLVEAAADEVHQDSEGNAYIAPAEPRTEPPETPIEKPVQQLVAIAEKVRAFDPWANPISRAQLVQWAGSGVAKGDFTAKDLTDALELGVNMVIANKDFAGLAYKNRETATAKEEMDTLRALLDHLPLQNTRTAETVALQQFSTPPPYAYLVNWLLALRPEDIYMEPSAGVGGLFSFAYGRPDRRLVDHLILNELGERRNALITAAFGRFAADRIFKEDAEYLNAILPQDLIPTVIATNPPFSARAGKGANATSVGAKHIEQDLERLAPGGRLVAIVGSGMTEAPWTGHRAATGKAFADWWTEIKKKYNVRANLGILGTEYAKYGTTFNNNLIVIDKTGPTTTPTLAETGISLEKALYLLGEIRNDRQPVSSGFGAATSPQPEPVEPSGQNCATSPRPGARPQRTPRAATSQPGPGEGPLPPIPPGPGGLPNGPHGERGASVKPQQLAVPEPGRDLGGLPPDETPLGSEQPSVQDGGTRSGTAQLVVGRAERDLSSQPLTDSLFEGYNPEILIEDAQPHNIALVESAAMSSVPLPKTDYQPSLPPRVVKNGILSSAQLESVTLIGSAWKQTLAGGARRGFFDGDGTGVGKGRIIAGTILDYFQQGGKKAVWVTEKQGLYRDAERDLKALGFYTDRKEGILFSHNSTGLKADLPSRDGVLFTTYSMLRSNLDDDDTSRLGQIQRWLGKDYDGIIIFDESHNMANLGGKQPGETMAQEASQQARAGLTLQNANPKARVAYFSATGATQVRNLAYAQKLGLWGKGTPFANANDFIAEIEKGGLASMETVAQSLKAMGLYVARQLSFDQGLKEPVTYSRVLHTLTPTQRALYDRLSDAWAVVLKNVNDALGITASDSKTVSPLAKKYAYGQFYSGVQRFFNQVLTSMAMPSVIDNIRQHLNEGHSVVLQLVNTNEAAQNEALRMAKQNDTPLEELDITPRELLIRYVENSFPVQLWEKITSTRDDGVEVTSWRKVVDSKGNPVYDPSALAMKTQLIADLNSIAVPDNPLDILHREFGDDFAEATGRSKRVVTKQEADGTLKTVVERRSPAHVARDVEKFNEGRAHVLAFSGAFGTGVGYHADAGIANQQKRIHYLLQPGWRADQAIQGIGRTHRTNEVQIPEYVLVTTDLPAQKRFTSTIARRLSQLGALTRGQGTAGQSGLFSAKDDLENVHAKHALDAMLQSIASAYGRGLKYTNQAGVETILSPSDFFSLTGIQLLKEDGNRASTETITISRFLNRLLAVRPDMQEDLFALFSRFLDAAYEQAKKDGTLDAGVENLKARTVSVAARKTLVADEKSGAQAEVLRLQVTRDTIRRPFEKAQVAFETPIWLSNEATGQTVAVSPAPRARTDLQGNEETYHPAVGVSGGHRIPAEDLRIAMSTEPAPLDFDGEPQKPAWEILSLPDARKAWNEEYQKTPAETISTEYLVTGALIPIWHKLPDEVPRVYRVALSDGTRVVGRLLPPSRVPSVLQSLGVSQGFAKVVSPQEAWTSLQDGKPLSLIGRPGALPPSLNRVQVNDEDRIEVHGLNLNMPSNRNQLEQMGFILESIRWQDRAFLPNEKAAATKVLKALFKEYPPMPTEGVTAPDAESAMPEDTPDFFNSGVSFGELLHGARKTWVAVKERYPELQDLMDKAAYYLQPIADMGRSHIEIANVKKAWDDGEELRQMVTRDLFRRLKPYLDLSPGNQAIADSEMHAIEGKRIHPTFEHLTAIRHLPPDIARAIVAVRETLEHGKDLIIHEFQRRYWNGFHKYNIAPAQIDGLLNDLRDVAHGELAANDIQGIFGALAMHAPDTLSTKVVKFFHKTKGKIVDTKIRAEQYLAQASRVERQWAFLHRVDAEPGDQETLDLNTSQDQVGASPPKNLTPKTPEKVWAVTVVHGNAFAQAQAFVRAMEAWDRSVQNYVPHRRYGRFAVSVHEANTHKLLWYSAHRNFREMQKTAAQLTNRFPGGRYEIETGQRAEQLYENLQDITPLHMSALLEHADLAPGLREYLMKEFYDMIRTKGFGSTFLHREGDGRLGIPGYERDLRRPIVEHLAGLAGWLGKVVKIEEYARAMEQIDYRKEPMVFKAARDFSQYTIANVPEFNRVRNFLFHLYLAGNLKSAFVDATQNFSTGWPTLGKYTKFPGPKLIKATKDWVLWAVAKKGLLPDEEKALAWAQESGNLDDSFGREMAAQSHNALYRNSYLHLLQAVGLSHNATELLDRVKALLGRTANAISLTPFSLAEQFNRGSFYLAAFRVFRNEKGRTFEDAKRLAADLTKEAHFEYGKGNKPAITRGLGAVPFTFQQWTANYAVLAKNFFKELFPVEDPRLAAYRADAGMPPPPKEPPQGPFGAPAPEEPFNGPLAGAEGLARMLLPAFLLGGIAATGMAAFLRILFIHLFGKDPEDMAREKWGKNWSRFIFRGTPAVFGWDISGPITPNIPNFPSEWGDRGKIAEGIVQLAFGPLAGPILDRPPRFLRAAKQRNVEAVAEALAPEALRNALAAQRMFFGAATTAGGAPRLVNGPDGKLIPMRLSPSEAIGKAMGFQPTSLNEASQREQTLRTLATNRAEIMRMLADRYVLAKDDATRQAVLNDLLGYNKSMVDAGRTAESIRAPEFRQAIRMRLQPRAPGGNRRRDLMYRQDLQMEEPE